MYLISPSKPLIDLTWTTSVGSVGFASSARTKAGLIVKAAKASHCVIRDMRSFSIALRVIRVIPGRTRRGVTICSLERKYSKIRLLFSFAGGEAVKNSHAKAQRRKEINDH